jgi:hypothetical protein
MDLQVAGFDWDHGNRDKCRAHGVALAEIEALFHKPVAVFPDLRHSQAEERFKAIGRTLHLSRFLAASARQRDVCSPHQRLLYA